MKERKYWKYHFKHSNEMYMIYTHPNCKSHSKIVSFDLDNTLIETRSGKQFPVNNSDWKWKKTTLLEKLHQEVTIGCKIVIFSNQNGLISNGQVNETKVNSFCLKIEDITNQFQQHEIFIQVFISLERNEYRKPVIGMWKLLEQNNTDIPIVKELSFFVGDAAGRIKMIGKKTKRKDFSCSDRQFARNIGIHFFTPEEYFDGIPLEPFEWDDIDMKSQSILSHDQTLFDILHLSKNEIQKEIILFIGLPSSGKTSFYEKYLKPKGYERISLKSFESIEECIDYCRRSLEMHSIVIDDTNHLKETRIDYLLLAKELHIPIHCYFFSTSLQICSHLEEYQRLVSCTYHKQSEVKSFKKELILPSSKEGFTSITTIPFMIDKEYISISCLFYSFL